MSEIVKRLLENHSMQNGDLDSIIAYAEYSNGVRRKAAAEIERLEAENIRLTTALENARKDALEEVEKLADEKTTAAIKAMEEPGKAKLGDGEDAFLKYFVATKVALVNLDILIAIRSLTPPTQKAT